MSTSRLRPYAAKNFDFPQYVPPSELHVIRSLTLTKVPTIAAINGHCYAGGLMLSLVCDYRVMVDGSVKNAWLCMNEVSQPFFLSSITYGRA